jgi:predicted DNA-binding transcriptional regulator AlpA
MRKDKQATKPEYLGLKEVADLLGISKQCLSNRVARKRFAKPSFKLSATPVWKRKDIEKYLKGDELPC